MIDTWLKNDLTLIFEKHPVVVLIDETGDAEFLLKAIEKDYVLYKAYSEIEELHVKYLIERSQPSAKKFLVYTHTTRGNLKFIREYCEIYGCLDISSLINYIRDKIHLTLNLNINMPKEELLSAAKLSIGKDLSYWRNLILNKGTGIFDLKKDLLPFLNDPEIFSREKYDAQLRETFYRKVNELPGQEYMVKPAQTLANEVVKKMLDGLAYGDVNPVLEAVYQNWLDSVNYCGSFSGYLVIYKLPEDVNIWSVNVSHPFRSIDEQWLKIIGDNIGNKDILPNYLARISRRMQNEQAKALGIVFWEDVKTLLEFDAKDIAYLSSFKECTDFYTKHFYKLDTAIRNLYTEFLMKKDLLEPFQELYKQLISVFLDKWLKYFDSYQENQTGILQKIINKNSGKSAVIVGDGLSFEVAYQIASRVNSSFKLTDNIILADLPSETENNMSRVYMANGVTEKVHNKREKFLLEQNPDNFIEFIKLDDVNEEARPSQFLICTYKDIDEMGESMQQKALKYFTEAINFIAQKITMLLNNGYSKVYLITDHGFVLTGLLHESDKIDVQLDGAFKKSERYIRTERRQPSLVNSFIEVEQTYNEYKYLYFSKTLNPLKTPGVYGYSHGGVSPQELITPFFCWDRTRVVSQDLSIVILNKNELKSITGEVFQLKIQSEKEAGDLFSMERKVFLVFFSNNVQVNKSDIFTIQRDQTITKDYSFDGNAQIDVLLLDALTKEQLDRATVKQNKDRDLNGLF